MKYRCTNCENISLRWEGRCDACGEWGTYEEFASAKDKSSGFANKARYSSTRELKDIEVVGISSKGKGSDQASSPDRIKSGIEELDRVLGGGFVNGEVVLLTGEPGVGKSTLLLQMVDLVQDKLTPLYVSGEESISQLQDRYRRIGTGRDFKVTSDTNLENIISLIESKSYDIVIVDSIQSISSVESSGFPGSISQVRVCGYGLMEAAKRTGVIVVIVGQINKEGVVAGPKVLEHLVDCVLHMEGDKDGFFKILRAGKNRFGSTFEIGVFQMGSSGLEGIENPSRIFLSESDNVSGSCVGAVVEGSRVVLLEVQALVDDHGGSAGPLRRVANGVKKQRLDMLCAVLSRRGGVFLGDKDVYVNISGGISSSSPSLDLAICAAIKSANDDSVIPSDTIYIGEVGLTGEVKSFMGHESVIENASRLGYKKVISPKGRKGFNKNISTISKVSEI